MCTPQAAAIFQVIGTVAQYSARVQQTQMENARREEARRNAARARDIQANQLAIRVKQEQDVKAQQEFDNQIAIMEAKSAMGGATSSGPCPMKDSRKAVPSGICNRHACAHRLMSFLAAMCPEASDGQRS